MNRPARSTALLLTPVLLMTLVGCASSSQRASTPSEASTGLASNSDSPAYSTISAEPAGHDEFVLGESFDAESVPRYHEPISRYTLDEIRIELESMYNQDGELVHAAYSNPLDPQTATTIQAIDQAHSDRLKEIVDHIGWPTRDLVGLKATQAAYMVIQHAGHDIEFQNRCLGLMVDLVAQGELPASYVALLTDRIRVFQNQPQVFGTQMTMKRNEMGVMVPTPTVPIEDEQHLDDRRALMGMAPHGQFVEAIQIAYEASLNDPGTAFAEVPSYED
ncbi:MAG: DUF6624 domain-containing protein [Phycisphaerales bacterium JB047]